MNILFLTIGRFDGIEAHSIYADLLRCFRDNGHEIYCITPYEKRANKPTELTHEKGAYVLHVKSGNVTGANNLIEKGIAQLSIEPTYIRAIKTYFSNIKFDLVIYSTPPITFEKVVKYIVKRDGAKAYLLLKDIFPQNAVDLGMLSENGINCLVYKYFRHKEKSLYRISDHIGCMSQANVDYVIKHNPEISRKKISICHNSIEVIDKSINDISRILIRKKYSIPIDKKVFVYGGNLGKPQGIPFLIECLKKQNNKDAFFLIVGDGSEYKKLEQFISTNKPVNVLLMKSIPKEEYDSMVGACDVGMIFLDHRFSIPNYPSRLLGYMQAKLPVLAATDISTDIGKTIIEGNFGWWCESNDVNGFLNLVEKIVKEDLSEKRENAFSYLINNFDVYDAYKSIIDTLDDIRGI